jgi:hypothetical protein
VQPSGDEGVPAKAVQIRADATQTTRIARDLDSKYELTLIAFLRTNVVVFVWQPSQMPKIPREVIEHHLKIYPYARPVQQKPQK